MRALEKQKTVRLLIIEDNPGDVHLMKEILKESKLNYEIHVVDEGEEGLNFVYKKGIYKNAPRPDLILQDWKLPKKTGRDFLLKVKEDPELKTIPIIIFSSSNAERDVQEAYRLHANCYLNKPINFIDYQNSIQSIEEFWLKRAALPSS